MAAQGANGQEATTLDADQLALLNHVVRIADQLPGDWSFMGGLEPGQEGDDAYRFQLSAMTSMLATVQFHHTPAYRELCRGAIESMVDKMLRFDTWGYWELSSRGGLADDPDLEHLGEGWINPVERKNVMYSGHLLNMINLHEMLYREARYSAPGALKFEYKPLFRGMGPQTWEYSEQDLVEIIVGEFEANSYLGCECEPNLIFPYCNQYPILAFMLHDHIHGTEIAAPIMEQHAEAWLADGGGLFSEEDLDLGQIPLMHFVKQQFSVPNPGLAAGLSVVTHPWRPEYAKSLYEKVRAHLVTEEADGTMSVDQAVDMQEEIEQGIDPAMMGVSTFGFMLLAAREMGDEETAAGLMRFADKNLSPVREDGCLHYKRDDDFASAHYATRLTTNGMIPWAAVSPQGGLWQIYNEPWTEELVAGPEVVDVDHPNVLVAHAAAGAEGGVSVSFRPGERPPPEVSFRVVRMEPGSDGVGVEVNGRPMADGEARVDADTGDVHVTVAFGGDTQVAITP